MKARRLQTNSERHSHGLAGNVYILSHPAWRNLKQFGDQQGHVGAVKIGFTRKAVGARGLQIGSASGLLGAMTVEWYVWTHNAREVEQAAHRALADYRITRSRELFCVPVEHARAVIEAAIMNSNMGRPRAHRIGAGLLQIGIVIAVFVATLLMSK